MYHLTCLFHPGVRSVKIDFEKKHVLVETALSATSVQELIEGTGRKAVLLGIGVDRGVKNVIFIV